MEKRLMPSMMALQCFEAVARHMSVTRAAEELHMTQSAISKQIAQLEALLRNPLFLRVRRRLQLTPAGALYQSEVRAILNQVDMSSRYILTYGSETHVLTIGTQPTFGARWLIPRLQRFMAAHPDIQVKVRSETRPFDLMQGKIDISFFFGHGTLPGAQCLAWMDSSRSVRADFAAAATAAASARVLSTDRIAHHLLGALRLADAEARLVDRVGNRNGRIDLGDVVAWRLRMQPPERPPTGRK